MNQLITFHKPNKKVRSEKMMDQLIHQTKQPIQLVSTNMRNENLRNGLMIHHFILDEVISETKHLLSHQSIMTPTCFFLSFDRTCDGLSWFFTYDACGKDLCSPHQMLNAYYESVRLKHAFIVDLYSTLRVLFSNSQEKSELAPGMYICN